METLENELKRITEVVHLRFKMKNVSDFIYLYFFLLNLHKLS